MYVALRKESVDRNFLLCKQRCRLGASLSARRAWIEIHTLLGGYYNVASVALRKESVDRNASALLVYLALIRSLSARRAWIEIEVSS